MKALLAFAGFFDITDRVASRLSRARFKTRRTVSDAFYHRPAVIGLMDVRQRA